MTQVGDLVVQIGARQQQLDQAYYEDLRALRQQHGDRAVDEALSVLREQRDAVAVTKTDWRQERRGPNLFRREKLTRLAGE